eukprot:COSAG05_NODE_5521_length_1153_cov_1.208729_1_plen_60_part_00
MPLAYTWGIQVEYTKLSAARSGARATIGALQSTGLLNGVEVVIDEEDAALDARVAAENP